MIGNSEKSSVVTEEVATEETVAEEVAEEVAEAVVEEVVTKKVVTEDSFFKRKFKRNWAVGLAILITFLFMVILMAVMGVAPFGDGSFTIVDSIHQYVPFFSEFQRKLQTGESLFYSWNIGGGQNFQSLLLYYMACPLNFLVVFFSRKAILGFMSSIIALKIVFTAGSMGYYLSRKGGKVRNNMAIVAFALSYALGNYMVGYYWNLMWLDAIMIFPLIMLGFDRLMRDHDPRMYVIALFYALFCNYYIAFMICIFLTLWFFVYGHKTVKNFFLDGFRFAGASILSAGLAAVSLIMAYSGIMTTASAKSEFPKWDLYVSFVELLKRSFFLSTPINNDNFDGKANLYSGNLIILLFFIYFFSENIRLGEKVRKLLLVGFLLLSMNAPWLNYLWHGFHDQYGIPNRFSFLYTFVLAEMGYDIFARIKRERYFSLLAGIAFTFAFLMIVWIKVGFEGPLKDEYMMLASGCIFVIYSVFLFFRKTGLMKAKLTGAILSLLCITEIIANAGISFAMRGCADGGFYSQHTEKMQEANETIRDEHPGFYREDQPEYLMLDECTYNGLRSLGTFCSTVRGDMVSAMGFMGFYTGANEYLYKGATELTNDLLGVKYIYVRDDFYYQVPSNYKKVYEKDGVTVYQNPDAFSLGYAVDEDVSYFKLSTANAARGLNSMVEVLTANKTVFREESVKYSTTIMNCDASFDPGTNILRYSGAPTSERGLLRANFVAPRDGHFYINVHANYIEEITYIRNGIRMGQGRFHMQLMDLGELTAGDQVTLEMKLASFAKSEGSMNIYLASVDEDHLKTFVNNMKDRQMDVTKFGSRNVEGDIEMPQNSRLFLTIPYDEGWTAKVDGRRVKIEKAVNAFMSIDTGVGKHHIELTYVSPGFWKGLIVSFLSLIIFIFTWIHYVKSRDRERHICTEE